MCRERTGGDVGVPEERIRAEGTERFDHLVVPLEPAQRGQMVSWVAKMSSCLPSRAESALTPVARGQLTFG